MTLGWPFSMTATQEFVVPRSMPMIFAMMVPLLESRKCLCPLRFGLWAGKSSRGSWFCDADQRRAQYPVIQAVAFLQHAHHRIGLRIGLDHIDALMFVG